MFSSLPLRAKFLIAPFIGGILTLIIYITSSSIINAQNELFKKINQTDLIRISQINHTIAKLARNNSDIVSLLLKSETIDEEQIYLQGKEILNELYGIEQGLVTAIKGSEKVNIDNVDIFNELTSAFSTYRVEAVLSLEMASVDRTQALYELNLANKKLKILNSIFLKLSENHLYHITEQANEIKGSLSERTYINEISILFIVLMFFVAFSFSDKMSTNLLEVYNALAKLALGDTHIDVKEDKDTHINNLWIAVGGFKDSINKNQRQQRELLVLKYAINQHSIISMTDLDGLITHVNKKFSDVSGYTKTELIGNNHNILNSNDKPQAYWDEMHAKISRGKSWNDVILNLAKDNSSYWVDTSIIPIRESLDTGFITGYMYIQTDISEQVKQHQKLVEAKKEAEAATISKSQFLANMSHEIRTPMNGVIGMAQLLNDTPLNDEQRDYLHSISTSGKNLLTIINDILDFSKLDFGAVELENVSFNLERICLECLEVVANNQTESNIEYIFDYHPVLPRYFTGDPARIRQILLNILSNATKFTKQGYIRLYISYDEGCGLSIEVEDSGIGINADKINHLFDEFSQADISTTRQYGGTGLGLSITKKLIDLMRGEISVKSEYRVGSNFIISLPLPESNNNVTTIAINNNVQNCEILLVDQSDKNNNVFKKLFEYMGADVTVFSNIDSALKSLEAQREQANNYRMMVINNAFSETETINAAKIIRQNTLFNSLKLVVFSTSPLKGEAVLYEKAGFNAYISKFSYYDTMLQVMSATLSHELGQKIITQYTVEDAKQFNVVRTKFVGKVLLVEDIRVNQMIANKMLSSIGLTVDLAENGLEAVQMVEDNDYDLIFMDCQMPVMDGYEATLAIRKNANNKKARLPIIALTANATKEYIEKCHQSKMDDVVIKPYQLEELQACLQEWLGE